MKKGIEFLMIGGMYFLVSCSGKLQTYDLNEEYATSLHYEGSEGGSAQESKEEGESLVGIPALNFYNGDLKRGGIWYAGKGITLEKGDIFIINANNIGSDSIPFGATFPPIDLITSKVVAKISARAESNDGGEPILYLQLGDANGYQANAKRPFQKIDTSKSFNDYYFELQNIFIQSKPKMHNVNGALINSLKFFINPGLPGFTGKIYIKEIKIVSINSVEK